MSNFEDFMIGEAASLQEDIRQLRKKNAAMLTALKKAKEFIENQQLDDPEWHNILDISVAAIAKAEGKTK